MQTGDPQTYITQGEIMEMTVLFAVVFLIIVVALILMRWRRRGGTTPFEPQLSVPETDPDALLRRGVITPEEAARMKARMAGRLLRQPPAPGERLQEAVTMERVRPTASPAAPAPEQGLPERLHKFADLSDDQLDALAQARFLEPQDVAAIRSTRQRR